MAGPVCIYEHCIYDQTTTTQPKIAIIGLPGTCAERRQPMTVTRLSGSQNHQQWALDIKDVLERGMWCNMFAVLKWNSRASTSLKEVSNNSNEFNEKKHSEKGEISDDDEYVEQLKTLENFCYDHGLEVLKWTGPTQFRDNRPAFRLIKGTVSDAIQSSIKDFKDPYELWIWLRDRYSISEDQQRFQLHCEWEGIRLSKFTNVSEMFDRMDHIRARLKDLGVIYSDDQMVAKIFSVVDHQFQGEVKSLKAFALDFGYPPKLDIVKSCFEDLADGSS